MEPGKGPSNEYYHGQIAYWNGLSRLYNPFRPDTNQHSEWDKGWSKEYTKQWGIEP